jgi:hypothetical protein
VVVKRRRRLPIHNLMPRLILAPHGDSVRGGPPVKVSPLAVLLALAGFVAAMTGWGTLS